MTVPPPSSAMRVVSPVPVMRPDSRFMAGEPMNWATNSFCGVSYSSSGVPTCAMPPPASTTMRDASVMASTWSCVT